MKRPPTSETPGGVLPPEDDGFAKKYPQLYEYMTEVTYEDGKSRDTSKVQLIYQEGRIVAALQDVEMKRTLFVSGPSLTRALEALEKAVGLPGADWRAWGGRRKK